METTFLDLSLHSFPHFDFPDVTAEPGRWAMKDGIGGSVEVLTGWPCGVLIGNGRDQRTGVLGGAETLSLIGFLLHSMANAPMRVDLRADFDAVVAAYKAMASRDGHYDRVCRMSRVEMAISESRSDDEEAAARASA